MTNFFLVCRGAREGKRKQGSMALLKGSLAERSMPICLGIATLSPALSQLRQRIAAILSNSANCISVCALHTKKTCEILLDLNSIEWA